MTHVWMRLRADVRRRALGIVGVVLLAGVAGGVVMTAFAGARRTASSLSRSERVQRVDDIVVNPNETPSNDAHWAAVDTLPQVVAAVQEDGLSALPLQANGAPDPRYFAWLTVASPDKAFLRDVDQPKVVAGRLADASHADEVVVNEVGARRAHLAVGDRLHIGLFSGDQQQPRLFQATDVRVVGIVRALDDAVTPPDDPHLEGVIAYTNAFWRAAPAVTHLYTAKAVRLRDDARDVPAFENAVRRLIGPDVQGGGINFQERSLQAARVERSLQPYTLALVVFGALATVAAFAVVGQVLVRSQRHLRDERLTLRSLGFTPRDLTVLATLRGAFVGLAAATVALAVAFVASPLMPLGPVRSVDPSRGFDTDWTLFAVGAAFIVVATAACCGVAMMLAPRAAVRRRRSSAADALARAGAPLPIASGARLALDRERPHAVPLRSTLVGISIALAAIVATAVYASGLTRFTSTPARYGFPWTYMAIESQSDPGSTAKLEGSVSHTLRDDQQIAAVSRGRFSQFVIDGRSVAAVGLDPSSFVPILEGRAPIHDDEVVLGETTMEQAHLHVGDTVRVGVQQQARPFRVVGTAVFPRLAPYPASEPTGLGIGAATTVNAIGTDGMLGNPFYLVRVRPGAHVTAAQLAKALGADAPKFDSVLSAQRPNDVLSWGHISDTWLALAAVLVLLAVGSAIHLLVTSVRSRRRDLALLKTVGFTRRQVVASVLAQATILVGIALVVAVPLGVLAGRWLWTFTARWIGIADDPSIPYSVIAFVVFAAIAVGNAIALGPGATAARTRPAVVLRSE